MQQYLMNLKQYKNNFFTIIIGSIIGVLFCTWLSFIVSWIPLVGAILKSVLQLLGALAGGFLAYKIKKDYFTRDKNGYKTQSKSE